MMSDAHLDDPDLEPSPYGHVSTDRSQHRSGARDLRLGHHRLRNAYEDYLFLVSRGVHHENALDRLGLDQEAFDLVYGHVYRSQQCNIIER